VSSRGVVVLGMHRSGTSAAARVVNLLGVPLLAGDDLLPADEVNPRGYWESASLMRFNDELLEAAGGSWSCPPVAPSWPAGWRERAREQFGERFAGEWVWKDPRASVTLPFWLDAFPVEAAVVLVHRDPLEIAASLARRDGFAARRSLALWERYLRAALRSAAGLPTLVVGYAELLDDPAAWAERVAAFLRSRGFASVSGPAVDAVSAFVDPALRRERGGAGELSAEQRALAARLEVLAGEHEALPHDELGPETHWTSEVLRADELAGLRARVRALEAERDDLLGSRSYRWTAPARRAAGALLGARRRS